MVWSTSGGKGDARPENGVPSKGVGSPESTLDPE